MSNPINSNRLLLVVVEKNNNIYLNTINNKNKNSKIHNAYIYK